MNVQFLFILFAFFAMTNDQTDIKSGNEWVKKTYEISGEWSIQSKDGERHVVFGEDFTTGEGPDVKVFLSQKRIEDVGKRESIDKKGLYLGQITDFSGAQSYLIPEDTKLEDYESIVLHCKAYSVVWGGTNINKS